MKVPRRYLTVFILLLVTEVAIAWFHFHKFVRGFLGDVLVIPTLYTLARILLPLSWKKVLAGIMALAIAIECLQGLGISELLGIKNKVLLVILGNTFDPWDLVAYFIGFLFVILFEFKNNDI